MVFTCGALLSLRVAVRELRSTIAETAVPTLSAPPRSAASTGTTAVAAGVAVASQLWVAFAAAGSSLAGVIVIVAEVLSVQPSTLAYPVRV